MCDNSIIAKYDKSKQCKNNGKCTYRVFGQQYFSNEKLRFSNYSYNENVVYTKKPQDPLDCFELEDVLDYIKETNILQYVFRVLDKNTTNSIKKIRELLKDDTKFVCSPILKDKH